MTAMQSASDAVPKNLARTSGWLICGTLYGAIAGHFSGTYWAGQNAFDADRHSYVLWATLAGILAGLALGMLADHTQPRRGFRQWLVWTVVFLLPFYVVNYIGYLTAIQGAFEIYSR